MLDKRGGSHRQKAGGAPRGGRSLGLQSHIRHVFESPTLPSSAMCAFLSLFGGGGGAVWEEDRTPVDLLRSLC